MLLIGTYVGRIVARAARRGITVYCGFPYRRGWLVRLLPGPSSSPASKQASSSRSYHRSSPSRFQPIPYFPRSTPNPNRQPYRARAVPYERTSKIHVLQRLHLNSQSQGSLAPSGPATCSCIRATDYLLSAVALYPQGYAGPRLARNVVTREKQKDARAGELSVSIHDAPRWPQG